MKNNKPDTLVILTPGFPENEGDTTCIPPQQVFVRALKEVNPALNVIVLTLEYPFFSSVYRWHGIKVISFASPKKGRPYRLAAIARCWITLKRLKRQHHVVGLLSFWLDKCAFLGNAFAKRYGLRHYAWLLGQDAKAGNRYFPRIKPDGASLIAISDFIAKGLQQHYGVLPHHVIPVGVNARSFSSPASERSIDILGAGSLIPLKQYHIFLETIKCVKSFFPDIKAVICGAGPEMASLQALVHTLDIGDNITFTGSLPHTDVMALMQQSKILLHPSMYEGFSTVCLEALCAGARVVSFIQAMDTEIENWYVARSKEHMAELVISCMQDYRTAYKQVLPYAVQDSARAIIRLFNQ